MARFSKVFQLLAVVLVIALMNVYVMAAPVRSSDAKETDAPKTTETTAEATRTEVATAKPAAAAAEKLPLAPGSKIDFNRIFSKSEIKSRAVADQNFLKANAAGKNIFKAPARTGAVPQDPADDDDDDSAKKGTWIAVGVLAAVLTMSVILLRKDRSDQAGSAAP
jgi:hypothetical protein